MLQPLPERIEDEEQLDDVLTRPSAALTESVKTLASPLIILGAGGKMGPTLAVLARRAIEAAGHSCEVLAVSRFTDPGARRWLETHGVKTVACDLLEEEQVRRLPHAENVVSLVGLKFGTAQNPAATWAMNTIVPAHIVQRYPRARIVALSTGNVYPLTPVSRGGCVEQDPLTPLGEYANAAVARERLYEFYARRQTTPLALLRLFYAAELRYGVPLDIARKVHAGQPVELANGSFNCIWQGDANDMILRALSLAESPHTVWNLCRPEIFSVRAVATRLGELLGRPPRFSGVEAQNALLGNSAELCSALGPPPIALDQMLPWIAAWVQCGGRTLDKPTHFEVRDGTY